MEDLAASSGERLKTGLKLFTLLKWRLVINQRTEVSVWLI